MVELKRGKYFFGSVKVGERGQVVIPQEARQVFKIKAGDEMLVVGDDKKGLAIVKKGLVKNFALKFIEGFISPKKH